MTRDVPAATFGEEIHRLRRRMGVSLAAVARELDCPVGYLCDIEKGRRNAPKLDRFNRLLEVIGATEDADRLAALAARGKGRLELDPSGMPFDRALLAVQFNRKLGDLPDATVREIETLLALAG